MNGGLSITLHGVSVQRGSTWALREVSWRLAPGERWALLGDNGAGKTQLLKLLCGDVWPTPGAAQPRGDGRRYEASGRDVELADAKHRIAYLGAERQDKYARYGWNLSVRDLIATGLHGTDILLHPVSKRERRRVDALLRTCRLTRLAARPFLSLSYGEKRLALLARALAPHPDWLLLDELYNGLDARYRSRIQALLQAARRRGQGWVIAAHRAADVPRGTTRLLALQAGRVQRCEALRAGDVRQLAVRAAERPPRRAAAPPRRRQRSAVLLELKDVDLFVEYHAVLRAVNWRLCAGEHWAVMGANGAGKSSFLKLLYGDLAPAQGGQIRRHGFPAGTPISAWKQQVGMVSPELQSAYSIDVSLLELVASGRHSSIGLNEPLSAADARRARRWLKFFELASYARRRARELSYGQLRRALIARALCAEPRILLLDEPLTGLDPRQRSIMKRQMRALMRRGITLIAAVHHAEDLPHAFTHMLRLHKRRAMSIDLHSAT